MTHPYSAELELSPSTETWKQWEGHVINASNGQFPLQRHLGSSTHSAVFLTEYGQEPPQHAAIKFIPDNLRNVEMHLSRWEGTRRLSHPNLLRVFEAGRCQLGDLRLLYVVMEYAEEDLSQILPSRALTPVEVRDMLRPALDALAYLHGMGLVHGHLTPGNIMACGDRVKLSSDTLCRVGEPIVSVDAYAPPEAKHSAAADIWALGMTLVEVLTQHLPVWEKSQEAEPVIPATLANPFQSIARRCLRRNPSLRPKAAEIASRLDPLPVQEAPQGAPHDAIQVAPRAAIPPSIPANERSFSWTTVTGVVLALVIATLLLFKVHSRLARPWQSAVEKTNAPALSKQPPVSEEKPSAPIQAAQAAEKAVEAPAQSKAEPVAKPILKPMAKPIAPAAPEEKNSSPLAPAQAENIHQVLPDVPQKARDTIRGTVRLAVKVTVDPAGRVLSAALDAPGPSRYFANLALQAARQWTFPVARINEPATSRSWILNFAFTPTDTRVVPVSSAP